MALDNEFGAGVEQNNPSGDTVENNNDVVLFNAFAVLPAVDDHIEADDDDAMLNASLGPSADANNMDSTPTPPGLLADGIGAPLASEASLGLLAGRSNSLGNADISGVGPGNVDGNVADVGDNASGYCSPTYGTRIHEAYCSKLAYPIT